MHDAIIYLLVFSETYLLLARITHALHAQQNALAV